jgi:agmatine/peptidylarginine deiminase
MKPFFTLIACIAMASFAAGQGDDHLPRTLTDAERAMLPNYVRPIPERGFAEPPPFSNLRNMAEWEEIQALTVTWRSYNRILKEIIRAAKEETKVIVFCSNAATVQNYLMGTQPASGQWPSLPPLNNMTNVDLVVAPTNSVWIRDYGANTVYGNRVDTLALVDWIYNRPRPADDVIPEVLANHLGLNLYTTTQAPNDLVNTGGNFMSDGQGTGFASELILEENAPGNPYNVSPKSAAQVDGIKTAFQGINPFIKMTALPYDLINHIDMHMKLIDEETLLVGEYPPGIADGPQINANIDYVLNNFQSHFGTPYKVVRIPMPDSQAGNWPDSSPVAAWYRTYTNGVFVNKTFIYPSYREQYDTTAFRIYSQLLPGYTLVPIDCDDNPEAMIAASGAIHCITHSVGVADPLLIVHQPLSDTFDTQNDYIVQATAEHRSGIATATLWWRLAGQEAYTPVGMNPVGGSAFTAFIPAHPAGTTLHYYVEATAVNGKSLSRPITAPQGFWKFRVLGDVTGIAQVEAVQLRPLYPNPAVDLVSVPVYSTRPTEVRIELCDVTGRKLAGVYQGMVQGDQRISLRVSHLPAGIYLIVAEGSFGRKVERLVVR